MLEMSDAGKYHRESIVITIVDTQLILDGTTWLDDGGDTGFVGYLYAIRKREKSI